MTEFKLSVGLGEIKVANEPNQVLVSYGLGSCVAVTIYDPVARVGGMAHVVLPDSSLNRTEGSPGKFADTAVPALVKAVLERGAARHRLKTWLVGGARMLQALSPGLDVGQRNSTALRVNLEKSGLPLKGEDIGGTRGRTVRLQIGSGRVLVSAVGAGDWEI